MIIRLISVDLDKIWKFFAEKVSNLPSVVFFIDTFQLKRIRDSKGDLNSIEAVKINWYDTGVVTVWWSLYIICYQGQMINKNLTSSRNLHFWIHLNSHPDFSFNPFVE